MCCAREKPSAIKKAIFEEFLYAHNSSCEQVFTLRGFLIQGEILREKFLRTAARPSTNWDRIRHPQIFLPASRGCSLAYLLRHRSVVDSCLALPRTFCPFAETSEAPAPPPAPLGLASLQSLRERASGPRAVPPTASAASASVLSGVSAQSVGATFGINSGESLAANEFSMYLSPSRVPRGLASEAGIDDPLRDSSIFLGERNLGTDEGHGLGMDEEQATFGGDGARESNEGLLG